MIAVLQLFFGLALGYAGIATMIGRAGAGVISLAACFFALVLLLKGTTRVIWWLSRLEGGSW